MQIAPPPATQIRRTCSTKWNRLGDSPTGRRWPPIKIQISVHRVRSTVANAAAGSSSVTLLRGFESSISRPVARLCRPPDSGFVSCSLTIASCRSIPPYRVYRCSSRPARPDRRRTTFANRFGEPSCVRSPVWRMESRASGIDGSPERARPPLPEPSRTSPIRGGAAGGRPGVRRR